MSRNEASFNIYIWAFIFEFLLDHNKTGINNNEKMQSTYKLLQYFL